MSQEIIAIATADTFSIEARWLGRVGYEDALALQEAIVVRKTNDPASRDELLLLEHDPVYTIGQTSDWSSLGSSSQLPSHTVGLPHRVVQTNRGGQATFHGPGQLIGYPIIDLRRRGRDLHVYLRAIEEALIETLGCCGVTGIRRRGLTGVWVGSRKIASIGVGVRRWISMHGFALNICGDLSPFTHITPCGIANVEMTSIEREVGAHLGVEDVAAIAASVFPKHLPPVVVDVSLSAHCGADLLKA